MFLKELFDVGYTEPGISDVIFMDRLADYGLFEYIRTWAEYRDFYRLHTLRSIPRLTIGSLRWIRSYLPNGRRG